MVWQLAHFIQSFPDFHNLHSDRNHLQKLSVRVLVENKLWQTQATGGKKFAVVAVRQNTFWSLIIFYFKSAFYDLFEVLKLLFSNNAGIAWQVRPDAEFDLLLSHWVVAVSEKIYHCELFGEGSFSEVYTNIMNTEGRMWHLRTEIHSPSLTTVKSRIFNIVQKNSNSNNLD